MYIYIFSYLQQKVINLKCDNYENISIKSKSYKKKYSQNDIYLYE